MEAIDLYCVPLDNLPETAHPTHNNSPEALYMLRRLEQEAADIWCGTKNADPETLMLVSMSRNYEEFIELYIEEQCR